MGRVHTFSYAKTWVLDAPHPKRKSRRICEGSSDPIFFEENFRENAIIPKLKRNLVDQVCAATGGPCTYSGKDMKAAHTALRIQDAEFGAMVEDLIKSLNKFKIGKTEQNELLGALAGMKKDIVDQ